MNNENDLIFGLRPVIEAIKAGKSVERILVRKGLQGSLYYELINLIRERGLPYQTVPAERLNQVTRKNHQGVVAWISAIEFHDLEKLLPQIFENGDDPFLLMLNGISDVRNFGAIARTAECFGVHGIIIPEKGIARINADAVKTSAGALHRIPVCRVKSLVKSLGFLKDSGLRIIATTEKSNSHIYEHDLTGPSVVIMGSEDRGISRELMELADYRISIPIVGMTESLNVSVAAGIILYEIMKQRLQAIR
ncbi:MAG TPA: 23S rRNA (guanosine(2251)-2'-O)-methyltransferase RlmB [Bacteroidales bacterium]|nr:23S rRNA (guanosine(2251)-2'-O)-methyltransferase RlmB [Bacteroidales bacterium]